MRRFFDSPGTRQRSSALSMAGLLLSLLATSTPAATPRPPEWIWGAEPKDQETRFFKKTFNLPAQAERAVLMMACDNWAEAYLNGQRVLRNTEWSQASSANVAPRTKAGENILTVWAKNSEGIAGLLVQLDLGLPGGARERVVSDASWLTVPGTGNESAANRFPATGWIAATSLGAVGRQPWGEVLKPAVATAAEAIKVLDGFKVELLRSSQPGEGSWVSMTIDDRGRLIVSPQGQEPMLRITLDDQGRPAKLEPIDLPVRGAMGLLHAMGSLYVNGQGREGYHLYRLRDTNGDDQYDSVELIHRWKGGPGEHGAHGIVLGTDGKLYTVCGNFVDVPEVLSPASPHRNYADDLVLPRMEDGNGFGAGRRPPGGFVARMNPDGSQCELLASGQRNTYDIAFNTEGELFGFDSDMEWDWGMPWYRPIRAFQLVSGGDQGFREGSAKWPEFYADSLPATVNIGIGSPTGVRFGTGARFPERYQRAFYMMDWSYGRIVVVHLKEEGAGYTGTFETLLRGKPLNVTDMEVGRDGALYFTTGGRGTQAGLYRVTYVGSEPTTPAAATGSAEARAARELRRQLEAYHGGVKTGAADFAWPHLHSKDRWIRYAARIAIESQPVGEWKDRALSETEPTAGLHAMLALARIGGRELQEPVLKNLARWPLSSLDEELKLVKLRVIEVSLSRHGLPSAELRQMAIEKLGRQFPAASWPLNRELSQILVALEAPGVISKVLDLRDAASTQEEQIHYMVTLRRLSQGWTVEERRRYFGWLDAKPGSTSPVRRTAEHPGYFNQWFQDVGLAGANGASFDGFMKGLRKDAIASLSPAERSALQDVLGGATPAPAPSKPAAPARPFVKDWKMEDLTPALDQVSKGRSFQRGKEVMAAGQCLVCHKFGSEGGAVGPEITAVSSRFTRADVLSSILEPSKVISEQYENTTYVTSDGDEISGRVVEETADKLVLLTSPLTGGKTELSKSSIKSKRKAKLSPMPEGLINSFSREEILDLLAYIESMGNPNHADFKKP
jgi:putative heme-binding domain-containing protein